MEFSCATDMWPRQLWCQFCSGGERKKSKCQNWKSLFWMWTGIGRKKLRSILFCYFHWGYNWMRHFVLQRTAGNNCLSPPHPYNKINNRLWSLVCFSFHQIPFMCYWGLAMWVGELKSEVDQYRCDNTSQCVTSPRHRGEREKKGLLWLIHQGDL